MTKISAAAQMRRSKSRILQLKSLRRLKNSEMENMQVVFQKHATATSTAHSSGPYRSRTDEKDSNDAAQQESYDRAIHKKI